MSYFGDQYPALRFPLAEGDHAGLRNAQLGALFATVSHFTIRQDPALIVLPTGAGKTAVLTLIPFLLRATRVLVATTSRLVRSQIAAEFHSLATPRRLGAVDLDCPLPATTEVLGRLATPEAWEALRQYDVVVATPHCVSPAFEGIAAPPQDLFDLLLIDEAHHTPARTWNDLLNAFPVAQKVFATATPTRRDCKEVRARLVYAYPLRRAQTDGIFGKIRYVPVTPEPGQPNDVAIAIAAARTLGEDRAAGFEHCLMVRTDSKSRADALRETYRINTQLRLQVVHSDHSYRSILRWIEDLRAGELDGVICVDMMSEGFDFPRLKVAAIHIPHKSLEVTLQFIGRFARTNAEHLGDAKFLAIPGEIQGEMRRLYGENAVWQDLIVEAAEQRLADEAAVREALETFERPMKADPRTEDLSLYSLWPNHHVKIYEVSGPIDLAQPVELPAPFSVAFQQNAPALSVAVVIGNEQEQPRWTDLDTFNRSEFELFVIYYDAPSGLLFINASRRSDALYEAIATQYCGDAHQILPLWKVNRVLRRLTNPDFFNVGMKNRVLASRVESYRIVTGSKAHLAVAESDGRLFDRGHVFGRGMVGEESETLGYSSAAKVWSSKQSQIPMLVEWCKSLARELVAEGPVPLHDGLRYLSVGEPIAEFPEGPLAVEWDQRAYQEGNLVRYHNEQDVIIECGLVDLELAVERDASTSRLLKKSLRRHFTNQNISL